MSKKYFIGIDIGGTKISVAVVDARGKILSRLKDRPEPKASAAKIMTLVIRMIGTSLKENKLTTKHISAIGAGVPGLVNPSLNKVIKTPNSNLGGTDIARHLKKVFRVPTFIGNDVNLGVLGEMWLGKAKSIHNIVGLFMGTGLGAGVVVHGKLLTGYQGVAAEIGHMIVDPRGPQCTCGNRGCLEAFVGRWAIERSIWQALKSGRRSIVPKLMDGKEKILKSKIILKALEKKDPVVTQVMSQVADMMGLACISLRHIFDPEVIIFGGGVVESCGEFILPRVERIVNADRFFAPLHKCRIVRSTLGDDAVMLGAVALAQMQRGKKLF
jgi:glucokinase